MAPNLYVAWQDRVTRAWHTIARLTRKNGDYEFAFTSGVNRLRSIPEGLLALDVHRTYRSDELISLFRNKLPSRNRSDFQKMANWLNLTGKEDDFALLAKFGLVAGSDSMMIYPEPEVTSGRFKVDFFVHGIRHMHQSAMESLDEIDSGSKLLALLDIQNPADGNAVALRTEKEPILLGYVPTFYASDVRRILLDERTADTAEIRILRKNTDAPIQLKLLCRFESRIGFDFRPFQSEMYKPLQLA